MYSNTTLLIYFKSENTSSSPILIKGNKVIFLMVISFEITLLVGFP